MCAKASYFVLNFFFILLMFTFVECRYSRYVAAYSMQHAVYARILCGYMRSCKGSLERTRQTTVGAIVVDLQASVAMYFC